MKADMYIRDLCILIEIEDAAKALQGQDGAGGVT
jgi:hypothetical protein